MKAYTLVSALVLTAVLTPFRAALSQERSASNAAAPEIGLAVGTRAPAFSLPDQSGRVRSLSDSQRSKGTVLLFFRSADWCPYCKAQLMDLQRARARFAQEGLRLVAISYDSVEILKSFADRRQIEFPLLADPESQIIRSYGVLNGEATGMNKGMVLPGYFFIDPSGVIREKFFEARDTYQIRYSANSVIGKLFPELSAQVAQSVAAPHIELDVTQSDRVVAPGSRITLSARVKLPAGIHVYAPGAQGYRITELKLLPSSDFSVVASRNPKSKSLFLPAIKETVPVYEGSFPVSYDLAIAYSPAFMESVGSDGRTLQIQGEFRYQACDDKLCFLPESIPVKWEVQVKPLDRQRAPEAIRHK